MTAHHTAKGIASLGRYGDDVIVHMSREEVKGLQALAQQHGTSLTINPKTGMPEAFKLGRIFKAIAPIAAGWMLGPGGFGMFSSPLMAGLAVGAGTGLLTGNLGQGLMAGLGAYGGFGLGDTFAKMGANAAGTVGSGVSAQTINPALISSATKAPIVGAEFMSPFTPNGIAGGTGLGVGTVGNAGIVGQGSLYNGAMANVASNQALNPALTSLNPITTNINPANVVSNTVPTSGFTKSGQGLKNLFTFGDETTKSGWQQFKDAAGTGGKSATDFQAAGKLAGPAFAVAEGAGAFDEPVYNNVYGSRMKRVPTGTYDAQGKPEYKYVPAESYQSTETLNVDRPYENYGYITPPPALKLVSGGGEIKSYAVGGMVQPTIQSGGVRDLYGSSDNQTQAPLSSDGYGLGRLNNLARAQEMQQAKTLGYAMGGPVSFADGGDTNLNVDSQPTLNLDSMQPDYNYSNDLKMDPNNNPPAINNLMIMLIKKAIAEGKLANPNKSSLNGIKALNTNTVPSLNTNNISSLNTGVPIPVNMNNINASNLYSKPTGMAKGGYLDGPGDGMSDSIPATIEGKQPARLADGEFVVPADVVSHLGNGSTKAGSKRLYAMLDKVRRARTGHVKQGRQINPNKYLPA